MLWEGELKVGDIITIKWEHDSDERRGAIVSMERGFLILRELKTNKRIVCRRSSLVMLEMSDEKV